MSISRIATKRWSTGFTSFTCLTGDLLVVVMVWNDRTTNASISGGTGNTWHPGTFVGNGTSDASVELMMWWSVMTQSGSVTPVVANMGTTPVGEAMQYRSTLGLLSFDVIGTAIGSTGTQTPTCSLNSPTAIAGELIVATFGDYADTYTISQGTNYSLIQNSTQDAQEEWLSAPQSTSNATFSTNTNVATWVMEMMAFAEATTTSPTISNSGWDDSDHWLGGDFY